MTSEKIKRLVELLVEREVRQILPILKKQIINELNGHNTKQSINETPEKQFLRNVRSNTPQQPPKRYSNNPLLNELISTATIPSEDYSNITFDDTSKLTTKQMTSTFVNNPEANINLQNENVQKTLDIITRDYSAFVKKEKQPSKQKSTDEDLSWLNDIG